MKKLYIMLMFGLLFTSCNTNILMSENSEKISDTTIQISNNLHLYPAEEFIDGSLWDVIVYYYVGTEMVKSDSIGDVLTGSISEKILIDSKFTKLKFSFQFAPKKSIYFFGVANCRRFSSFINLEVNQNNAIEIHDLANISLSL